eukprot:scaffold109853_cov71-Phaeocystis_antarctica.AAC.1
MPVLNCTVARWRLAGGLLQGDSARFVQRANPRSTFWGVWERGRGMLRLLTALSFVGTLLP